MIESFILKKEERLNSKIAIGELFGEGAAFIAYPLRFIYRVTPLDSCQADDKKLLPAKVLISVSKRYFKRAVKRNLIKRQIREAYRLNNKAYKSTLTELNKSVEFGVLYVGKEVMSPQLIEKKLVVGLNRILSEIKKASDETTV